MPLATYALHASAVIVCELVSYANVPIAVIGVGALNWRRVGGKHSFICYAPQLMATRPASGAAARCPRTAGTNVCK